MLWRLALFRILFPNVSCTSALSSFSFFLSFLLAACSAVAFSPIVHVSVCFYMCVYEHILAVEPSELFFDINDFHISFILSNSYFSGNVHVR